MAAFRAVVSGRVQGVGFRYSTIRRARALHLYGAVSNQADGSVAVTAEGPRSSLEELLAWLSHGPPGAHVRDVTVDWVPWSGRYRDFEVEF
ncbi:MAG TPA: acylphosphatase [Spirochaetia bacterium]|nr:acylphosphatase [Spirochaetia bacterium]